MSSNKEIFVYAHWAGLKDPTLIGILVSAMTRGKEIFSFEYTKEWLQNGSAHFLDPDLQLFPGRHYTKDEKLNFGAFLDSCPDRWGRMLMDRREEILARKEKRTTNKLLESDYLLGVYDEYRMGALRFKLSQKGLFLNDNKSITVPPWTQLKELEYASLKFEEDIPNENENLKWLNELLAPGSSLGGARPKASVQDSNQNLWMAKFPSVKDTKNIGAWEMVANTLASKAGLLVASSDIKQFNSRYHTFLTKRFDRNEKGERIHFASAMTLLGYIDGDSHDTGISYLEMAEFIIKHGANVNADLEELWRRIVFFICIKNTDDHLRNHGFLLTEKGWTLSPAYDMNPNEYGNGLSLNISEKDNSLDLQLALSVAEYFRVDSIKAVQIKDQIKTVVNQWRSMAKNYGLTKLEQDRMSGAFDK